MQKHPLDFVGQSAFRWGGRGGKKLSFDAVYVTNGKCGQSLSQYITVVGSYACSWPAVVGA